MRTTVIGGGLAGSEAAWQLAQRGVEVELLEMKPGRRSPAHVLPGLAELVCSNSLRSDNPSNAVGLLHEELRRLGSLVLSAADETRVPAGDALAVDRERFSALVTARLDGPPARPPDRGGGDRAARRRPGWRWSPPVRSPARRWRRSWRRWPAGGSHFYDAIAPIVADESDRPVRSPTRARATGRGTATTTSTSRSTRRSTSAFVEALLRGGEGAGPRVRGAALLRGLPADRGDGRARRRRCWPTAP